MSEMIERVARAMHKSAGIMLPYDVLSKDMKNHLLIHAKAAITAMREPTEDVVKKMRFKPVGWEIGLRDYIDAALKE